MPLINGIEVYIFVYKFRCKNIFFHSFHYSIFLFSCHLPRQQKPNFRINLGFALLLPMIAPKFCGSQVVSKHMAERKRERGLVGQECNYIIFISSVHTSVCGLVHWQHMWVPKKSALVSIILLLQTSSTVLHIYVWLKLRRPHCTVNGPISQLY